MEFELSEYRFSCVVKVSRTYKHSFLHGAMLLLLPVVIIMLLLLQVVRMYSLCIRFEFLASRIPEKERGSQILKRL